ncbi:ankyrin [Anaeromyces robustus]|uniref:Ankyrin n=1 Tax=Anaeromyces robustus TaxID=1754192 RepID=A0A1Y1X1U4_9FUNG|nr:ankyrin [Anaeromyces robustus]|eukprot:ORX79386.1 ankyrin [Anaeromyces robustus]
MSNKNFQLEIQEILIQNNKNLLKNYFSKSNIKPSDNDLKDLIIFAIENDVPNDMIIFLLDQRQDKNVNFEIKDGRKKIPIFIAVAKDNYTLADILLNKYKADINYIYKDEKFRITEYLYYYKFLTSRKLKYVLEKGTSINYRFLYKLIMEKENKFYELRYTNCIFRNDDIIKFLNLYKKCKMNKEIFSDDDICNINNDLKNIIHDIKNRIHINEDLYKISINNHNDETLRITFENDTSEESIIRRRIIQYNLFDKSLDSNNYNYVEKILGYKPLHYMCKNYEEILSNLINKYLTPTEMDKNKNIAKLVISKFIKTSIIIYNKNNPFRTISKEGISFRNLVLNIAIKNKNLEAVKYLCRSSDYWSSSNEINTMDIKREYPIFSAIEYNCYNIFKYLIKRIHNRNIKNSNGLSILTFIIMKNNVDMAKNLLKYENIFINEKDSNSFSPLEYAINQNNAKIVELILNYGIKYNMEISVNKKDDKRKYPLIEAIYKKNFDMVFSILDYCNQINSNIKNIKDNNGNTPLILSYKLGDLKIFNYLLEYYDINQTDLSGNTILHYSLFKKDFNMIKQLLFLGANPFLKNNFDKSPMDIVFNQKNYEIFKIIIQYSNIDLNVKNSEGDSLLTTIIKIKKKKMDCNKKKELIELLIKKGINVNILDKKGNTPLVYAFQNDYSLIYKLLIKNGAYYQNNEENDLWVDEFIQSQKYTILENLYNNGYEMKKLNFNSYKNGNTLLHEAIKYNNPNIIKYLLDYGADTTIKNNDGNNAYEYSKFYHIQDICYILEE